jgi:hypothetical protein
MKVSSPHIHDTTSDDRALVLRPPVPAPTRGTSQALIPYRGNQALVPVTGEEIRQLSQAEPRSVANPSSAFNTMVSSRRRALPAPESDSREVVLYDPEVARRAVVPSNGQGHGGQPARLQLTGQPAPLALPSPDMTQDFWRAEAGNLGQTIAQSHDRIEKEVSSHLKLLEAVSSDPQMTGWHLEESLHHLSRLMPAPIGVREALAHAGEIDTRWKALGTKASSPAALSALAEFEAGGVLAHLGRLEDGESLLLPGGWAGENGGHAMLYEFKKHGDDLLLKVYNTGVGVLEHSGGKGPNRDKLVKLLRSRMPEPALETLGIERGQIGKLPDPVLGQLALKHLTPREQLSTIHVETMVHCRYFEGGAVDARALEQLIKFRLKRQPGEPSECMARVLGALGHLGGSKMTVEGLPRQKPQTTENCTWKVGMAYCLNNMLPDGYDQAKTKMHHAVLERSMALYQKLEKQLLGLRRKAAENQPQIESLRKLRDGAISELKSDPRLQMLLLPSEAYPLEEAIEAHFGKGQVPSDIASKLGQIVKLEEQAMEAEQFLEIGKVVSEIDSLKKKATAFQQKAELRQKQHTAI